MMATHILAAAVGGLVTALLVQAALFQIQNPCRSWVIQVGRTSGAILGSLASWELIRMWLPQ
jgi:ABC-type enterobactin transport system permease subunit